MGRLNTKRCLWMNIIWNIQEPFDYSVKWSAQNSSKQYYYWSEKLIVHVDILPYPRIWYCFQFDDTVHTQYPYSLANHDTINKLIAKFSLEMSISIDQKACDSVTVHL